MKKIFFICFIGIFAFTKYYGQNNIEQKMHNLALKYFEKSKRVFQDTMTNDKYAAWMKSSTQFEKYVDLPFKNIKIAWYTNATFDVNQELVYYNGHTNELGIFDTLCRNQVEKPITKNSLKMMNNFLKYEPIVSKENIALFAKFLTSAFYNTEMGMEILASDKDISSFYEIVEIPEDQRKLFKKPVITGSDNKIEIVFYCQDNGRQDTVLYKVKMTYKNKKLTYTAKRITLKDLNNL